MRKIGFFVLFAFVFLLTLSSCNDESEITFNIGGYSLYGADMSGYSAGITAVTKQAKESFNDGYFTSANTSTGNVVPLTAVTTSNKFEIYAQFNAYIKNDDSNAYKIIDSINIKSFEIEVNNNIKVNDSDCKKDNIYKFDVKKSLKHYILLSVEMDDSVTITIKSVTDENDKVYNANSYNQIRLIKEPNIITFNEDYKSFTIDTTNVKIEKLSIDYEIEYDSETSTTYDFSKTIHFEKQARITYSIPGMENLWFFLRYEIADNKLYQDFYYTANVIHTYE